MLWADRDCGYEKFKSIGVVQSDFSVRILFFEELDNFCCTFLGFKIDFGAFQVVFLLLGRFINIVDLAIFDYEFRRYFKLHINSNPDALLSFERRLELVTVILDDYICFHNIYEHISTEFKSL